MDKNLSKSDRAKAAIRPAGYGTGALAALGGAGYGAHKMLNKKEKKK